MVQQQDKHDLVRNGARAHRCSSPSLRKTAHGVDSSFSPHILLIAQWIIHPGFLLPPSVLSHLFCPEFVFNTFPEAPTITKSKSLLPFPQHQGQTLLRAGYNTWKTRQRNTLNSWMSELVVIIREQLQLKYPAGEGWTCSKTGIVQVFVTKCNRRMDQQ